MDNYKASVFIAAGSLNHAGDAKVKDLIISKYESDKTRVSKAIDSAQAFALSGSQNYLINIIAASKEDVRASVLKGRKLGRRIYG